MLIASQLPRVDPTSSYKLKRGPVARAPVSFISFVIGGEGLFCFSFPAFFQPGQPPPLPQCCRWDFNSLEKPNPGSALRAAATSCATACESLFLSESPSSVTGGWRGQGGLQGPLRLLSLCWPDTPSHSPSLLGAGTVEKLAVRVPRRPRVLTPQLEETQSGRQVLKMSS